MLKILISKDGGAAGAPDVLLSLEAACDLVGETEGWQLRWLENSPENGGFHGNIIGSIPRYGYKWKF